ncbi:hypothetical protein QYM36_004162 [Artemia franciscana]|uniref:Cleavage stimulation factor 50 kDa subunit n=2 Tax=Artemia franciscana TaxID=6661 RepID=A0AA88I232_ARTSF|nr:hypothetical protein QYM36_004162 [Artemia franciscana]
MEFEGDIATIAPEPAMYDCVYSVQHKGPGRYLAFSCDGQLVASGSADTSIKIMDVDRMVARAKETVVMEREEHPVIRTIIDHTDEVSALEFHPREPIITSGSLDMTVKFFDYTKVSLRKSSKTIYDVFPINCMSYHPSGDFLVVGVEHPTIRMHDVATTSCFACPVPQSYHTEPITSVKYSPDGRFFASGSKDGSIKIWDGISCRCVTTFTAAHDGAPVCSVDVTRNGKYVLSSGMDSVVRLWELSTNRCLIAYTGAGGGGKQMFRSSATLNHTEEYVMMADETTGNLCSWDARNATRKKLISLNHSDTVRHFAHSHVQAAYISTGDDHRVRFWYRKA